MGRIGPRLLLAFASLCATDRAHADGLHFPVDCDLGNTCMIQQYVDRDPGGGALDYTCGPLSYNNHQGTDIRVPDRQAMLAGVDVLSATAGEVIGTRDGMRDMAQFGQDAPDVTGKECGNGVMVRRKDGWRFQYCHLARGSVAVAPGDRVIPGQILGQIGLSGRTQFPHLHFQIMDQAGRIIDPFDAREHDESCRLSERSTLWATLDPQTDYQPGGSLAAGFATGVPEYDDVRAGIAHADRLGADAPSIIFWVHFFGVREGDEIVLKLFSPDGSALAEQTHVVTRTQATQFRALGRRTPGHWSTGTYHGSAYLVRDGSLIARIGSLTEVQANAPSE